MFTDYPDGGYYFRTTPPDSLQGQVLADVITDDGATSVGIICWKPTNNKKPFPAAWAPIAYFPCR